MDYESVEITDIVLTYMFPIGLSRSRDSFEYSHDASVSCHGLL